MPPSDTEHPLRCVGYTRVSTQGQAVTGHGLDSQREKIEQECSRRGWAVEIRSEGGVSSRLTRRPVFSGILVDMRRGEFDVLMVSKLDRMCRSVIEGAKIIQDAKREGWQLVVLNLGVDMSTSIGMLITNVLLSIAEFEREMIIERTKDGLVAARNKGIRLGRPASKVDPVVDTLAHDLRARGAKLREIAEALTALGMRTPQGRTQWTASNVNYLLTLERTTPA